MSGGKAIRQKIARLAAGGAPRVLDLFSGCGGLSLGFHVCSQDDYLAIVNGYAADLGLIVDEGAALEWAKRRGARSGRVAWHYVTEMAGQAGLPLKT